MENEKWLIDYQKAREIVLDELKGKVTTDTAVMLSTKMKYATVDAVEVVHGRWEKYQRYVICSNCGTGWPYYKNDTDRFRYCPNCGAKMDGDGNG